jgi:sugar (pentulose or hexulose) kinase
LTVARPEAVAVLDIGKSNAKLALVDLPGFDVLAMRTMANVVLRDEPYARFDVERLWRWLIEGLREFAAKAEISVISTTTHGACFVVLAGDELALPVLDYEHPGPEAVKDAYRLIRGAFAEIMSPDLTNGLNVGRQLYWLSRTFPDAFARVTAILPYPQYWVWRLSGMKVAEVTSFGSHTDLWNPRDGRFSSLAQAEGWAKLVPPMVPAWQTVGRVLPDVARETGLPPDCRVVAGIHDSNASLLPHILKRPLPFAVISTGTWIITFAAGGALAGLDPERDCLAYVDAFGRPVPSAMVMGGREFEILSGGAVGEATDDDLKRVVSGRIMALPAFVPGSGPYGKRKGEWSVDIAQLTPGLRLAAAGLYSALVAETCLGLTRADGPVIVEGPFSRNRIFLAALAQLVARPVIGRPDATGTTAGAALLALGPEAGALAPDPSPTVPLAVDLSDYRAVWRAKAEG